MTDQIYQHILGLKAIRSYEPEPIKDDDLARILEAARWTGSAKNEQAWSFIVIRDQEQRALVATAGDYIDPILSAPLVIALVEEVVGYEFDSGRVGQNIMLAAAAIGVASCPITLHRGEEAAKVLGLRPNQRCRYAIALGYPAPTAAPVKWGGRKPLDELVHWERVGDN